jgi:hypothetical protein
MKIRHLNKIVFLNSADIDYQEIELDGNVHFIGDQGAGKSTVLRALLYLYNPSNEKSRLGIGKDDKYFLDYYFEFDNSHIVYEIQTEDSKFCIWLTKEGNRPAFRFIDKEYQKDYFMEKTVNGYRFLLPDEIKTFLRSKNIDFTRKLQLLSEYKNVFYGASKENNLRQYSLMQSQTYQNIPNTITNVFLSTSLKSSNIKQTIIHSLVDEEQTENQNKYIIDLSSTRKDIEEFEQDFNDIAAFDVIKIKVNQLITIADKYNKLEQDKIISAQNLGESQLFLRNELDQITENFQSTEKQLQNSQTIINQRKANHLQSEKDISDQLTILRSDLEKAQKLDQKWKNIKVSENLIGIESILLKIDEKGKLQNRKESEDTQLQIFKTQFDKIELKYDYIFKSIENEKQSALNLLNNSYSKITKQLNETQNETNEFYSRKVDELNETYEINSKGLINKKDETQKELNKFIEKRAFITSQILYNSEIDELQKNTNDLIEKENSNLSEIKIQKNNIESIKKLAEPEEKLLLNEFESKKQLVTEKINKIKSQIKEIDNDLQSYESSLYKFLNDNYSGWESKFAKVCYKEILFSKNLKPKIHEISELFYGLEIDLSEIDTKIKSIQDYETDKENLETSLNELQFEFQRLIETHENDKTEFIRKHNKKIAEIKRKIESFESENYQLQINRIKFDNQKEAFVKKAIEEKAKQLAEISPKITSYENQITEISEKIEVQSKAKKKQKESLDLEKIQKIKEIDAKKEFEEKEFESKTIENEKSYADKRTLKNAEKLKELSGEGADIKTISEIESRITAISELLKEIEQLQKKYVNVYEVEKEEIFKIQDYSSEIQKETASLQTLILANKTELDKLEEVHKTIKILFDKLNLQKEEIELDIIAYDNFQKEKLFDELAYYIQTTIKAQKHDKIINIIAKLKDTVIDIGILGKDLLKLTKEFVSPFRPNNIFNFPKEFSSEIDCLDFIQTNLKEYIEEEKIEIVKQQTKKKHSGLINHIVGDIDLLVGKRKDIDKIIHDINNDFKKDNFVHAIEEFELRTQDTANNIVQIFVRIKELHDDNSFNFEEPNLFTNHKMEESKQKSINLLTSLLKALKEFSKTEISLEDVFELEFKAKQNNKETGWKKELSDVGSHGTDILLKAMIYIMLLNVFKETASKKSKFKDFRLHCIMDEIGRIHTKNIKSLIKFANNRDIWMIFGSPEENDALAYKYVYNFEKKNGITNATRLIYDRRQ